METAGFQDKLTPTSLYVYYSKGTISSVTSSSLRSATWSSLLLAVFILGKTDESQSALILPLIVGEGQALLGQEEYADHLRD